MSRPTVHGRLASRLTVIAMALAVGAPALTLAVANRSDDGGDPQVAADASRITRSTRPRAVRAPQIRSDESATPEGAGSEATPTRPESVDDPLADVVAPIGYPNAPVSDARYGVGKTANVPVTLRDGVVLRVDVYFPTEPATGKAADGRFPALLTQTPYGKGDPLFAFLGGTGNPDLVRRGYIEVVADVRGRGASGGVFDFWGKKEHVDGLELARFAAKLPHSNGRVGLFGASYMGQTQFLTMAVAGRSSPIKAAVPVVSINNVGQDGYYGGMPNFGFGLLYAAMFPATGLLGLLDYLKVNPAGLPQQASGTVTSSLSLSGPLLTDMATGGPAAYDGLYWQEGNVGTHIQQIAESGIPALIVGGWYDIMGKGSAMTYVGIQNALAGRPLHAPLTSDQTDPRFQWLNGPFTHGSALADPEIQKSQLLWFDHWLKGFDNGVDKPRKTAHLDVIDAGARRFLHSNSWPLNDSRTRTYYFGPRSHTGAQSLNDGSLTTTRPTTTTGTDRVAWSGLSNPCSVRAKIQTAGLLDLIGNGGISKACGPTSVPSAEVGGLSYTTAPSAADRVVAGPIGVDLYASSTTRDAEFIVGLSKVDAQGHATNIQSGALLGSLRELVPARTWYDVAGHILQPYHPMTEESSVAVTPGKVTRYSIGVWPTAFMLRKGERLRVVISTSDVPYAVPSLPTIPNLLLGIYGIQRTARYPSSVTVPFVSPDLLHVR